MEDFLPRLLSALVLLPPAPHCLQKSLFCDLAFGSFGFYCLCNRNLSHLDPRETHSQCGCAESSSFSLASCVSLSVLYERDCRSIIHCSSEVCSMALMTSPAGVADRRRIHPDSACADWTASLPACNCIALASLGLLGQFWSVLCHQ